MSEWRFLLDENVDPKVATYLEKEGLFAVHVRDALERGADDEDDILPYARAHDLVVVTSDVTDFGALSRETRPASSSSTTIRCRRIASPPRSSRWSTRTGTGSRSGDARNSTCGCDYPARTVLVATDVVTGSVTKPTACNARPTLPTGRAGVREALPSAASGRGRAGARSVSRRPPRLAQTGGPGPTPEAKPRASWRLRERSERRLGRALLSRRTLKGRRNRCQAISRAFLRRA